MSSAVCCLEVFTTKQNFCPKITKNSAWNICVLMLAEGFRQKNRLQHVNVLLTCAYEYQAFNAGSHRARNKQINTR